MKNLIVMALDKAERLTDEELKEEIKRLESGKKKLHERVCVYEALLLRVLDQILFVFV